jgi:hypothetical protein
MAVGGRHQTRGHNNQLKVGVDCGRRDIAEGAQLLRNVGGGGVSQSFGSGKWRRKIKKLKYVAALDGFKTT